MEALLIDEWLSEAEAIRVLDEASLSLARQSARDAAKAQGLRPDDAERLATIATELGRNQLRHASQGLIAVRPIVRSGVRGVEIAAADRGGGIADPATALAGVARPAGTLGVGLAAVRDLSFEVDFDVRIQEGSFVRARIFEREPASRRQIGVFGKPIKGERASGDEATFVHLDDGFVVAVCDGLGHGPPAREASARAVRALYKDPAVTPQAILEAAHLALVGTRGAVMAVARFREATSKLETGLVGNVIIELVGPRSARRFGGSSAVLGTHGTKVKRPAEATRVEADETLVMFTDGVSSRTTIKDDLALLREHPIIIAQRMVELYASDTDDVLVLVARAT